jgi:high-affinity nickel permease
MSVSSLFFTLVLGFLLGIKHAFDADHLVAISTLVSHYKNPLKAAFVGMFWGIGHTLSLFVVGIVVLLLRVNIPEQVSLSFEFLVGVMLVILGIRAIVTKTDIHAHNHEHDGLAHTHLHLDSDARHFHRHKRSVLIGMVHGLAGSGALTILVLSTISSVIAGIVYILIFGIGSIIGMSLMSVVFGLPFILTKKKFPSFERHLGVGVGVISILFGLTMMYELGGQLGFL